MSVISWLLPRTSLRTLVVRLLAVALAVLGLGLVASSGWVHAKAEVGQWLMWRSWQRTQFTGSPSRPWPSAEFAIAGRLVVPSLAIDQLIADQDHAQALAFAPGLHGHASGQGRASEATALNASYKGGAFGSPLVISGHRDTHFAFLKHLQTGDLLQLDRWLSANRSEDCAAISSAAPAGFMAANRCEVRAQAQATSTPFKVRREGYRIAHIEVVDSRRGMLPRIDASFEDVLVLTTCYPFDAAIPGGPLRYVIIAFKVNPQVLGKLLL